MVDVVFTGRFIMHRGAMYNANERASLSPEDAAEAFRQGVAVRVQDVSGYDAKMTAAPPKDKQVRAGQTK